METSLQDPPLPTLCLGIYKCIPLDHDMASDTFPLVDLEVLELERELVEARDAGHADHSLTEEGKLFEDIANSGSDGMADIELEREPTASGKVKKS